MTFDNKEEVALKVSEEMFMLDRNYYMGFFRKSLNNMRKFWYLLNREDIVND